MFENIPRMVSSTWEFFIPPISRLLITVIIFTFIFGSEPLSLAFSNFVFQLNVLKSEGILEILKDYQLLPLVPIIVLFFLAFFIHAFDRIVFGIANLFPLKLTYCIDDILLGLPAAESIWQKSPSVNSPRSILNVIDSTISQARIDGRSEVLEPIDSWQRNINVTSSQYSFMVFLLVFLFVCLIFSFKSSVLNINRLNFVKILIVFVFEIVFLVIFTAQNVFAIKQHLYSKAHIADALITLDISDNESKEERYQEIQNALEIYRISVNRQKWWYFTVGFANWTEMLLEFRFPSFRYLFRR